MPHVKVQAVETVEGCTHEVSAVQMNMESLDFLVEVHMLLLVLKYCLYYNTVYIYCCTNYRLLDNTLKIVVHVIM